MLPLAQNNLHTRDTSWDLDVTHSDSPQLLLIKLQGAESTDILGVILYLETQTQTQSG